MTRPPIHPGEILADELSAIGIPQFWLNLQSAYDLRVAEAQAGKKIDRLPRRGDCIDTAHHAVF